MSYQEGMQIGNMGMNLARTFMMVNQEQGRQEDREKKLRSEANIEKYIPMVQQGKEPDRKAKDFNYTDYLSAQTKVQQALNADVGYQNNMLVKEDNQRKANQANLDNMLSSGKIYADQGDPVRAAEILAPIYNFMPDNQEFVRVNPDNRAQWIMKDQRTNEEYTMDAVPYDQAVVMAQNFSKAYQEVDKTFQEKRRVWNNKAILKRDVWKTPDGKKEVYYFTFLDKNGAMRETWKDTKTGEVVKGFDVRTGQVVESDLVFRSPEYRKAKAAGEKAGLERRGKMADVEKKEADAKRVKEGRKTKKDQIAMNKSMYTAVEKGIKTYRETYGSDVSEEGIMLEENRLRADYKSRVDPDYQPDPKSKEMVRKLVVNKPGPYEGQTVYFNAAGKAFLDRQGKKPLMGGEQEDNRSSRNPDGSLRRFQINSR